MDRVGQKIWGLKKSAYILDRELGRGGEGTVYELKNSGGEVAKIYNEPLDAAKAAKLKYMAAIGRQEIYTFAAWPLDVIVDDTNAVSGFVMRRLAGYFPLHMLFSPMDRKKLFPEKGYNFLVHVARNLATAFYKLHSAGLVIGDVNEGNILVDGKGMIAFIDCDSFQVREGNNYHYCEVGVPRYTPPELLEKNTFANVVRSVNTDSFSLSVLIFQLLFLGRHPFAGRNSTGQDMDEETAIRTRQFAYSLKNRYKKLSPPVDSFPIGNLPEYITGLFHDAFEGVDNRPSPQTWITALDALAKEMTVCRHTPLHTYPTKAFECPWCYFKEKRGIVYFFDDSHLHTSKLLHDIDSFVNGFRVEQLNLKKHNGNIAATPGMAPTPIDRKFYKCKRQIWQTSIGIILFGVGLALVNWWFLVATVIIYFLHRIFSPAKRVLLRELKHRYNEAGEAKKLLDEAVKKYNNPPDAATYQQYVHKLQGFINSFVNLPQLFDARKRQMEESLYGEQLHQFLLTFDIRDHAIATFGKGKKLLLYTNGIKNASDISRLATVKVLGIGPKSIQELISWQRQVGSLFIYKPDAVRLSMGTDQIIKDIGVLKSQLENDIRRQYQATHQLKSQITQKQQQMERYLADLSGKASQAELNFQAFKKLV